MRKNNSLRAGSPCVLNAICVEIIVNNFYVRGLGRSILITLACFGVFFKPLITSAQNNEESATKSDQVGIRESQAIVITPSRFAEPINKVGSSISVVSEEELESRKEPNLLEALRNVESLQVIQSGGPGRSTGIFLRGASPNQTLVLVDGIPVNEGNSGLFDFGDLTTLDVGSVEVLRGPQSLMYGADAMGGVINIISKKIEKEPSAIGVVEAGSYGTQRYVGRVSGGDEIIRASGAVSFFDSDNISVANERNGNNERDPYDNLTISNGVEVSLPSSVEVKSNFRYTRARTSLDTFDFERGFVDALNFAQRRDTLSSNVEVSKEFDFWIPSLIMGYNFDEFEGSDSDNEFNNYDFTSRTLNLQQLNNISFSEEFTGLLGYSYRRVDGQNVGNFDKQREINSLFYQQTYRPFELTSVSAGARHDNDSTFGGETTYRITGAQEIPLISSILRSSFGTGFRAPTFNDLYYPNFSNSELEPETSRGADFGISTYLDDFEIASTYFITY